jgi:hypothetical protein
VQEVKGLRSRGNLALRCPANTTQPDGPGSGGVAIGGVACVGRFMQRVGRGCGTSSAKAGERLWLLSFASDGAVAAFKVTNCDL